MNYIVKSGDSLSKIARDVLGDMSLWPEIAKLNNITDPDKIYPGQVLNLAVPKRVTIDVTESSDHSNSFWGWLIGLGLFGAVCYAFKRKSNPHGTDTV